MSAAKLARRLLSLLDDVVLSESETNRSEQELGLHVDALVVSDQELGLHFDTLGQHLSERYRWRQTAKTASPHILLHRTSHAKSNSVIGSKTP